MVIIKFIAIRYYCSNHLLYFISYNNRMVFQSQSLPHHVKTGVLTHPHTTPLFTQSFHAAMDLHCDIYISKIISDQQLLQHEDVDLDRCFVTSDQSLGRKNLGHYIPIINGVLLDRKRPSARKQLEFLVGYFGYLGIKCILIEFSNDLRDQLGKTLNQIEELLFLGRLGVVLKVVLTGNDETDLKTWHDYINFRKQLQNQISLHIFLQVMGNLPGENIIGNWIAQKIAFFSLDQNCFVSNNKGYPVLPASHEKYVKKLMRLGSNVIIHFKEAIQIATRQPYFKYLSFAFDKLSQSITKRQSTALKLLDYLQNPLQPYADNLQSETYQIFQFDQPKYDEYQIAIRDCLEGLPADRLLIVYYIGCGRGRLVNNVLSACKATKRKVLIYAIDKNPYSIQTLKLRVHINKWSKFVKIIKADIKDYVMPEKPDIFLSELLGGFGDNQLSPECLQWAQKNIAQQTRCIPMKYTSFVKPVCYGNVARQMSAKMTQTYYTVNFGWHHSPFKSKQVWNFQHPLQNSNLCRQSSVSFQVSHAMVVNGFIGSFTTDLSLRATLSIVPEYPTIDSYSWFPLFFPSEEYLVETGDVITIEMKRESGEGKIWYQWKMSVAGKNGCKQGKWRNIDGKSVAIYLSV